MHFAAMWMGLEIIIIIIFKFYFIFKLYIIVLVLPNIKMNAPQVYMCSPSWTFFPPPSPYHPSGSSQCTSPKHPVSCIVILSEISQKKTNTIWCPLYVESKIWYKLTYLSNRNKLIDIKTNLWLPRGKWVEEGWVGSLRLADANYYI